MQLTNTIQNILMITILMLTSSTFAVTIYTTQSGDSLWKIANKYKISGISTKDMIKSIKGINSKETPSINDNIIGLNQRLTIPTTKQETKDGIQLYTLRHTQYLNNEKTTPKKTESVEKFEMLQKIKEQQIQKTEESSSSQKYIKNQAINSNKELKANEESINSLQPINISNKKSNYNFAWFITILIAITIIFLWRYFLTKEKSTQDNTNLLKDQFYAEYQNSNNNDHKKMNKRKSAVEKKINHANQLIDSHDISQAKAILQDALNLDPKNLDIRIKLLSVYASDGDKISFNSERDYLASNLLPYDDARWKKIENLHQKYFGV